MLISEAVITPCWLTGRVSELPGRSDPCGAIEHCFIEVLGAKHPLPIYINRVTSSLRIGIFRHAL